MSGPPSPKEQIDRILVALRQEEGRSFALAELNDLLSSLPPALLAEATADIDVSLLGAFASNYVAAMVEHACDLGRIPAPTWTSTVAPLEEPYFATELPSLRLHLLRSSPIPFKRRNIFIDASIGDRV